MAQPSSDRLAATALNFRILDANEKIVNSRMLNTQNAATIGGLSDNVEQWGSLSSIRYHKTGYVPDVPAVYRNGYNIAADKQSAHIPYVSIEGSENGYQGNRSEYASAAYHGYSYSTQRLSKPYDPVTTELPSARSLGYLYNGEPFSTCDPPCLQQPVSANNAYILSASQVSPAKLPVLDLRGDSQRLGLRPNYLPSQKPSARVRDLSGNCGRLGFQHQGYESSNECGGMWSEWLKPLKGRSSLLKLSSSAVSPFSQRSLEVPADDFKMASQQKRSVYQFGTYSCASYQHSQTDQGSDYGSVSTSTMGINNHIWPALNEARKETRCIDFSCSSTVTLDLLAERNRGPRSSKPKFHTTDRYAADKSKSGATHILSEPFNRLDFVTNYRDAKFFIIKSYSEDNVHKSIKYGVWASTPNGNKKLNAAYHEAKEKSWTCPIFLLFSVNASAQFCGVAEMVGPVDFNKSVDYWLQDKWSGKFPVTWHIIKDVPNSQFRHILLRNNDSKPVTNSRDTQEVEMEQGIEMLHIFKKYEMLTSILDDFRFYEQRQKAMEERKGKKQANRAALPEPTVSKQQIPVSLSTDFINKTSKSFAEAVSLNDHEKVNPAFKMVVNVKATNPVGLGS